MKLSQDVFVVGSNSKFPQCSVKKCFYTVAKDGLCKKHLERIDK